MHLFCLREMKEVIFIFEKCILYYVMEKEGCNNQSTGLKGKSHQLEMLAYEPGAPIGSGSWLA